MFPDVLLYLILALLAIGGLLWFMCAPSSKGKRASFLVGAKVAHRGLHDKSIKENTFPGFVAAAEHHYGVELDVHLSSDGVPVISHDPTLTRVFGIERAVSSLTREELADIGVPTLAEVLQVLDKEKPLVVEIKGENGDTTVCQKTAEVLDGYDGCYCIESFNPLYVRWFKKHRPDVVRGQLSTHFGRDCGKPFPLRFLLKNLFTNMLGRPHFIAYEHRYGSTAALRFCRLLGAVTVAWTVKTKEEEIASSPYFSGIIFESYRP